ncbi:lysophospholipid acyltransferase family protein [Sulfurirhabdus autotrophica]|uniref:1-acyl-sn-glycerol-3-phosphate acyltransferase n=1 Tax=Sulfurirhabdus autotrophica TaxID=1706046 RepID=A0A4R3Y5D2_9PROT|nr:lysophospholipid acyltransferase family protein [Sulfurirhabdus autotrophica]TCV87455.1 1-acyl-sn-glycerol-3-phosphate acyltransferase [Sulfurirhabdus autotrophica]
MNPILKWLRLPYEYFVLYGGLLFFGVMCLSWSLPASLLYPLLPRKIGAPLGQFVIMAGFRSYIFLLNASGIVKCDLSALDALRKEGSLIIAPNHPALIDVVLVASRLPHIVCVMKAWIWDSLMLGGGARLAGYIRNDSPGNMIRLASAATQNGNQLLIFPEGTRTQAHPINDFKAGFALIAKKAGVPVQTVFIETNSPFLCKDWPLLKKPEFPIYYRVCLGQRFEVSGDVKTFVSELKRYFIQHLESPNHCPGESSPLNITLNA